MKKKKKKILTPKQQKQKAIISFIWTVATDILLIIMYRVLVVEQPRQLGWLTLPWTILFLAASLALNITIRLYLMIDTFYHADDRPARQIANDYGKYQEKLNLIYKCSLVSDVQVLEEEPANKKQNKQHICRIITKLKTTKTDHLIVYYDFDKQELRDQQWLANCYHNFSLDFAKYQKQIETTFPNQQFAIEDKQIVCRTKLNTEQDLVTYLNVLNRNFGQFVKNLTDINQEED